MRTYREMQGVYSDWTRPRRGKRNKNTIIAWIIIILILMIASSAGVFLVYRLRKPAEVEETVEASVAYSLIKDRVTKKKVRVAPVIDVNYIVENEHSRPGDELPEIKNIYVHYTANPNTSARQNRSYFNDLGITKKTSASTHLVIGYEGEIVQCLPFDEIGYAVAGRNYESISIECCYINKDGRFESVTKESLIELLAWLIGKYDLSIDNILRHYDDNGKSCPKYYVENEDEWNNILMQVENYIEANGTVGF